MPIVLTPVIVLVSIVLSIFIAGLVAWSAWRCGHAAYLDVLKKKHFEEYGYNRDGVSQRLHQVAAKLGHGYQQKDNIIKSLGEACIKKNLGDVELLSNTFVQISARIDQLWAERHGAEATAKLIGFGQLVDEIHAKGIPSPKPVETVATAGPEVAVT